jgi:two-component system, OmpR family, response regulator
VRDVRRPVHSGRLLIVDAEPAIADCVATALGYEGFEVDVAHGGCEALTKVKKRPVDLVVLDVMLPDLDGFEVTRRLRQDRFDVPILFLTAKSDVDDRVTGLRLGADDYVTKPFSLLEIVARVHTILRRGHCDPERSGRLRFADVEMDEDAHLVWRGGAIIKLTATEFRLHRLFLLNPDKVLPKEKIISEVWNFEVGVKHNVVETYVGTLRRKLEKLGPPLIYTVHMVGYTLREAFLHSRLGRCCLCLTSAPRRPTRAFGHNQRTGYRRVPAPKALLRACTPEDL